MEFARWKPSRAAATGFLWFAFFGEDLRDLEPGVRLLFIPLQAGVESLTGFWKSREPSKFDAEGVPPEGVAGIGIDQSTDRRFTGHPSHSTDAASEQYRRQIESSRQSP